jgi:hypothetical protein
MRIRSISVVAAALLASCALYNEVSIAPLVTMPTQFDRGADLEQMLRKNDYLRAMDMAPSIEARQRKTAAELGSLGEAYLAAGRYDVARRHLRNALELKPKPSDYADIAWALSQVEYMQNNYQPSLEWARIAIERGLQIRRWHLDYLEALSEVSTYEFSGAATDSLAMRVSKPDVPRIEVAVNGREATAIIDSGAVLSIVSESLAARIAIKRLGKVKGEFFGLLGEPIAVEFGLLESIDLGKIRLGNVPVAIMPNEKMQFLITGKKPFHMELLLGANLLKEFRMELDFGRDVATFTRLTARDRVPDAAQNLFIEGFRPHVRGLINRKGWFIFILDTGSEVTFLNDTNLRNVQIPSFGPKFHGATMQGLGGARKSGAKIENVEIGIDRWAGTFKTLPMYSSDETERAAGIIGENFLKNFRVIVDFGRMRVELIKRGPGSGAAFTMPPAGPVATTNRPRD